MTRRIDGRATSTIVGGVLLGCVACLVLAGVTASYIAFEVFPEKLDQLVFARSIGFFDLDHERNLPAWFSTLLLSSAALLSLVIGILHFRCRLAWARHWLTIGLLFLLLSLDESVSLHERAVEPLRAALGAGGLLYWTWVVPGAIFVLGVTAIYWKFVFSLPPQIRLLAITSASLYVAGALGLEMVGGYYAELDADGSFLYQTIAALEEGLEMLGASLFIYTLLRYCEMTFSFSFSLKTPVVPAAGFTVSSEHPPRQT